MIVTIASVHHTGTNFTWQDLFKGWHQYGMNYPQYFDGEPTSGFCRIHCDLDQSPYLPWWLKQFNCVVPLRHPLTVAASWKARGKNLKLLPLQWNILKVVVDPHLPMYLPIDSSERDRWLADMNKRLGLELQTDWPVIMSCNKSAELNDAERESVFEVMEDGFFDRFGYEV